jgi:hypothetical protein
VDGGRRERDVQVEVESVRTLSFDDGSPVRAASAIAPYAGGWLVAQDDSTHAAWVTPGSVTRLRLLPPVEGLDEFSERDGTKELKPDLEAACEVLVDGVPAVLLLGSGSSPRRMRGVLVREGADVLVADLTGLYGVLAGALGIDLAALNIEGACRVGPSLRLFQRGNLAAGLQSAGLDLDLHALVAAVVGRGEVDHVPVLRVQGYDLGEAEGVGLAATDAVALPGGRVLLSAAAEDTPNAVDDGPVVATALVLVDDDEVLDTTPLPEVDGRPHKVEGLVVQEHLEDGLVLLAVVDADDPDAPSPELVLRVRW